MLLGQAEESMVTQESGTVWPGPSQDSDPEDFQDPEESIQAQIQGIWQNQDRTDQVLLQVLQQIQKIA